MSLNENLMGVLKHRKLVLNADFFMPTHFLQPMTRGGESASHISFSNLTLSNLFACMHILLGPIFEANHFSENILEQNKFSNFSACF